MTRRPPSKGNPYRALWWLGGGLGLLLAGVLAVVLLAPDPKQKPDPERTVLWLYDAANPTGEAVAVVVEESGSRQRLVIVPLLVPGDVQATFADRGARKGRDLLTERLGRRLHHHVMLPYTVLQSLVDGAKGLSVDGWSLDGAKAVAYVKDGGNSAPNRAASVMLALADAVAAHGLELSPSEGFRLARQVETDLDLMLVPEALSRWSRFGNPQVKLSMGDDLSLVKHHLLPDD